MSSAFRVCRTQPSAFALACIFTSLVIAVTLLHPLGLLAQSADTAGLEIYVHDVRGGMLANAKLHLVQQEQNITRDAVTDKNGHYRFTALPVGDYVLAIDKEGFKSTVTSGITLSVSQMSTMNLPLSVAGDISQVTVTTEVPIIDTDRTTIGQTLSTEEIETLLQIAAALSTLLSPCLASPPMHRVVRAVVSPPMADVNAPTLCSLTA
ncbi:MAG TPA: carboxypeptidase-like regulatory domain-containing protein [Acidobacteriaceae bacterium]